MDETKENKSGERRIWRNWKMSAQVHEKDIMEREERYQMPDEVVFFFYQHQGTLGNRVSSN